jgi:hypothetical protein
MTLPITLMTYVARRFAAMALLMVLSLSALVALFDLIELLRRAATRPDANFVLVSQIAALRLPYVAMQILPFAVLLGGSGLAHEPRINTQIQCWATRRTNFPVRSERVGKLVLHHVTIPFTRCPSTSVSR